ncbi:MAG TPA: ribosome biogenesis GTPase Der [Anaerolineae bacterium]|nr:ribosome biogenesis GTPase Der [Anaerolineae bacterium]
MTKPFVALVGRPNVGKSTLFNRLVGERLAVVDEVPGTTRDRLHADSTWNGHTFRVIDTGGIDVSDRSAKADRPLNPNTSVEQASIEFLPMIRAQAEIAIQESDAVIFVVDAEAGLTNADREVAEILRRYQLERNGQPWPPIFLAANKADNPDRRNASLEFYELGLGQVYAISAQHGLELGDLLDAVVQSFPPIEVEPEDESVKISIVGRPNVGKSSLLNALLGQERAIVSPVPGTTRDAIDTPMTWGGLAVTLIDTAGIRKRGHIDPGVEQYSVLRALRAIERSDVALLVIDAVEGVTAQDAHVAGYVLEENKSVVIVINKWDMLQPGLQPKGDGSLTPKEKEFSLTIRTALNFLDYVPVMFVSAKTGLRVDEVMAMALRVQEERLTRIPTSELNRILREAMDKQAPPTKAGQRLKIFYASQVRVDPPTFLFHVNDSRLVHFTYERYLENQIRSAHPFVGTPLRLSFRNRARAELE